MDEPSSGGRAPAALEGDVPARADRFRDARTLLGDDRAEQALDVPAIPARRESVHHREEARLIRGSDAGIRPVTGYLEVLHPGSPGDAMHRAITHRV